MAAPYDWQHVSVTLTARPEGYAATAALRTRDGADFLVSFDDPEPGLFPAGSPPAPIVVGVTFPGALFVALGELLAPENELPLDGAPGGRAGGTPRNEKGGAGVTAPGPLNSTAPRAHAVPAVYAQAEYASPFTKRQGAGEPVGMRGRANPRGTPNDGHVRNPSPDYALAAGDR